MRGSRGIVVALRLGLIALLAAAAAPLTAASAHSRTSAARSTARPADGRSAGHTKPKQAPSPVVTTVRVPKRHGPAVQTTLTTSGERYALRSMPAQYFVKQSSKQLGERTQLVVDDGVRYQRIIGFGGAMTDSSAWLIEDNLTAYQRKRVLRALFSPTAGIDLDVTRVPIGSSDFTATGIPYTYDDAPTTGQTCANPAQPNPIPCDPSLQDFSIAHDLAYIIPALRAMLAIDPKIKILSTEWSPPAWMKANDNLDDLGGAGTLLSQFYGALADYLAKFVAAYKALGVPIWAITPENEPGSSAAFPAMDFPAPDEASFITADLVPTLRQDGLHPRIFGLDGTSLSYAEALEQSSAASSLAGIAWHCYGGQQVIGEFHQLYPHVVDLTSECSPGIIPYRAAEVALSGLNNYSSLIELWNLALDPQGGPVEPPDSGCRGCTGLITVNPQTRKATYSLNYYELGQFSKFIRAGARRVAITRPVTEFTSPTRPLYGVTAGLDDVAAVNPGGRRVVVVYNNSSVEQYFAVAWDGQSFKYKLPPHATVTFAWRP